MRDKTGRLAWRRLAAFRNKDMDSKGEYVPSLIDDCRTFSKGAADKLSLPRKETFLLRAALKMGLRK